MEVDESNLTGETECIQKNTDSITKHGDAEVPLAERLNIVFMGTLIRHGNGNGVVLATGKETEFGRIFDMVQGIERRKTPLQEKMDELGKKLSFLSFGIIGIIMMFGIFQGRQALEMFTIGGALAKSSSLKRCI